jgi:hypothetical protein
MSTTRTWPTRNGRFGIQQIDSEGEWTSCTIWCGYEHASDALAEIERRNGAAGRNAFRVFHRNTGEIVSIGD